VTNFYFYLQFPFVLYSQRYCKNIINCNIYSIHRWNSSISIVRFNLKIVSINAFWWISPMSMLNVHWFFSSSCTYWRHICFKGFSIGNNTKPSHIMCANKSVCVFLPSH